MARNTKSPSSTQVTRLRQALDREKAKSAALAESLAEAVQRQAAAAEILKIISRSPADPQPVFDAIARSARRLFGAHSVSIARLVGGTLHLAALTATTKSGDAALKKRFPVKLTGEGALGKAILSGKPAWVVDFETDVAYSASFRREVRERGYRSLLAVPMIREGTAIGGLAVTRRAPGRFTAAQIRLLQTFSDQAVIAIENARLFNETKEALERQTATAEILKVISSSPTDVQPVFDAIVQSAARLFDPWASTILMREGNLIEARAVAGPRSSQIWENVAEFFPLPFDTDKVLVARVIAERRLFEMPDTDAAGEYAMVTALARAGRYRSITFVPLVREGEGIGAIALISAQPGARFSAQQLGLLQSFADQAVIAIENVRLFNETKEALERQTATSDILRVIASSPSDVQPVFDAIAASSMRLLKGQSSAVTRVTGDTIQLVALTSTSEAGDQALRNIFPVPISNPSSLHAKVARSGEPAIRTDAENDPDMPPIAKEMARARGYRSDLVVPMLQEGTVIGAISVTRREPGDFGEHQVNLLKTFADQAVIAIENVRLFNETKEALERQTATGEVLSVIARSPSDVQPVLDAVAERAARLCGAPDALILTVEGGMLHRRAHFGSITSVSSKRPLTPDTPSGRAVLERRAIHVEDILVEIERGDYPEARELQRGTGFRTILSVPLMREDSVIGVIGIRRLEVRPFTEKQIELVRTFADQAVIAIENVRLFNETKEALERQTATSEILKVIAGSPTDVQPVFDVIVESAVRLCGARFGRVYRYDGSIIEMVAGHGLSAKGLKQVRQVFPRAASDDTIAGRVILTRQPFFLKDIQSDESVPELSRKMIEALDTRSQVTVPMLRAGESIGAITIGWDAPGAFDDQQVALLQTFADQAVIAIENVRLFNETKEALERQTATAEILKVIAASPSDTQPVFDAIVGSVARLFGRKAALRTVEPEGLRRRARSYLPEADEFHGPDVEPLERASIVGQAVLEGRALQWADTLIEGAAAYGKDRAAALAFRSIASAPLMLMGRAIGVISVSSPNPGALSDKQVALLQTFADQAVIAIENVRLFNETKEALERQTATAEILKVIASSPSNVQPVFDAIASAAMRLIGGFAAAVTRVIDDQLHLAAFTSTSPEGDEALVRSFPRAIRDVLTSGEGLSGRAIANRRPFIRMDTEADPDVTARNREVARARGYRSGVSVPLIREEAVIGTINVSRREPGAFSDYQVELLQTFAAQAVIAIENVRLFNETKEALERQTATAEILKVIASSPSDVQPVFDAIVRSAGRLFNRRASLRLVEQGGIRRRARSEAAASDSPDVLPIDHDSLAGRVILDAVAQQVTDTLGPDAPPYAKANAHKWDFRANAAAPLIRDETVIGLISVASPDPGALSDKQMALLATFADQAVIAIENVRLFTETKEALERQTATAEVLRVISNSPTDTQPVFEAIAQSGLRLFPGAAVAVALPDGDQVRAAAIATEDPELAVAWRARFPVRLARDQMHGAAILDRRLIDVPDAEAEIDGPMGPGVRNFLASGNKAITIVPMIRGDSAIGAISVIRLVPGPLKPNQIALLQTFADQAVIAIENVRLFNETKEALERQTATAEILKVISATPTDVRPVLDAVVSSAARLCEAKDVAITLKEGDQLRYMAHRGEIPTAVQIGQTKQISNDWTAGRAALEGRQIHIRDVLDESEGLGEGARMGKQAGYRTVFATPLLRHGAVIGVIVMRRGEVRPFEPRQIELVNTFAEQAVIAIENVRLFNETKEALERQTATAEILNVIASSPSDVQPVFDAIAASARRLLGGHAALVARRAGDVLQLAAFTSTGEAGDSELSRLWPSKITGKGHMGKALLSAAPAWVEDIETDPGYSEEFRAGARARGMRSAVSVPMLREGEAIGVISVNRSVPGRFSDHQTNLLKTFADQALIAIENVRMFNETQEALARQEAAAQVLRSISESVADTAPVFTAILDCCNRLIPSIDYVQVQLIEGSDRVRLVDHRFGQVRGAAPGKQDERRAELMAREAEHFPRPLAGSTLERALHQGRVIILADTLDGPDTPPATLVEARRWGHSYSQITVPLMREGRCIGAIEAFRRQLGGFQAKESSLLESFADQAVIAIENVRLFNETKEALDRQTATAEILKVISSSPTDVEPVFVAIVQKAVQLSGANRGALYRFEGGLLHLVAHHNQSHEALQALQRVYPMKPNRAQASGRTILSRAVTEIRDVKSDPEYLPGMAAQADLGSLLAVPMLRGDGTPTGVIVIQRPESGSFAPRHVELVKTFADQAVIAIENVRLFKELQSRTEALTKSVGQLTALGEVGQAISSTLDLEKVLKTIATHAVRLTGLDGASIYEYDEASEAFRLQAADNQAPEVLDAIRSSPIRKGDGTVGKVAITLQPIQVADILDKTYRSSRKELLVGAGYRAVLTVPLLREDRIIGALSVTRKSPGPFAEEIVELMKTFATQSAMAIQNARLFREIAEKGKQLEEASKHKSQFLASMSHELRTPLNAILGFNEMILGDIYGEVPADMKEPLTDIQTSGKHLLRLINNVLDLAKIEAGRMELALDDYSVHDTVESVRSTLRPLAEAKGLELAVDVPPDIPLARGDGGRITQCLMNLAGNSLKFTKQGSVGISVALENGTLTYRVKDTGIGISADKIGGLFTEFKQTDATIASEYGGTGLGLSITKKFIEMHGGRIWAESEPGSGSTFIFEVPLRAGEAGEA